MLDEQERRIKENPLKYAVQHAKQIECTNALEVLKKTIITLFWGNRVGKTEWGAQTVAKVVLGECPAIPAPAEVWSFCPSFDEQKDTTQKKLLRYIPEHRILDRIWLRKGILKEIVVDSGNGQSKVTFKSYEQGREKAQGAGKALIWFDEEPPYDIFEECTVRQEAGITLVMILTMTAVKGMTWVYDKLYLNTNDPDLYISEAGWDDNPFLTEEQKEKMGRRLSASALKVRKEGKFVKLVGLVCSWFGRETHIFNEQDLPNKKLPPGNDYFCLDFGFSAFAAGLWIRVDHEMNFWIFDGFYKKGLTTPEFAEIIKLKEHGLGRVERIGDSAQASDIKQLNDLNIDITGIKKEPKTSNENWDEYRARLMQEYGAISKVTGKPKIFISSKLTAINEETGEEYNFLVKEIENLRWEEVKTELGIQQKPRWGKQPNHAIDDLSYILASIDQPPEQQAEEQARINQNRLANQQNEFF